MKVILASKVDPASRNMLATLTGEPDWGWNMNTASGTDTKLRLLASTSDGTGDALHLVLTPHRHLYVPSPARELEALLGEPPELVVILSRHTSASGIRTLTVHYTGNFTTAELGGEPSTLSVPAPFRASRALRFLSHEAAELSDFAVSFEATHHGPTYMCPHFFIEIGSSEAEWGRKDASAAVAGALGRLLLTEPGDPSNGYPVVVGIGGGHYAPRHTDAILTRKMDMAHIIPTYAIEAMGEDLSMVDRAMELSGTDSVYLHRKGMKGPLRRKVVEYLEYKGFRMVSSKEYAPL